MNKFLPPLVRTLPAALVFTAAAVLSSGAYADDANTKAPAAKAGARADATGEKEALAVKLVQLQLKNDSALLADDLANSVVRPMVAKWGPQVESRVPPAQQKDVRDKLDAELQKLADSTRQVVQTQAAKTAQDVLVPIYLDKLSANELKTIVAYLQTPASGKFAALGSDATQAWLKRIVAGTQTNVQGYIKNFDDAAEKIVNTAAASAVPASGAEKK